MAVGIYTTNSAEACLYNAEHSKANIIVVEDEKQLEKIQSIRSKLPNLKVVVQYDGEPKSNDVLSVSICVFYNMIGFGNVFSMQWEKLMEHGRAQSDDLLEATLKSLKINECCTLVYTVSPKNTHAQPCLISNALFFSLGQLVTRKQ